MRIPFLALLLALVACSGPPQEQPAVPEALQQDGVIGDIKGSLSGRSYGKDLVDALFEDVLKNDTALQHLLDDLQRQYVAHGDSTAAYHRFEAQNRSYYESALEHTAALSDSVEREAQRALLRTSEERHRAAMSRARQLDDQYEAVRKRTMELVELIKLQRTLQLMEEYQRQERPHDAELQAELERIRALEQRLNEAVRK
jgi:hypothetical protein